MSKGGKKFSQDSPALLKMTQTCHAPSFPFLLQFAHTSSMTDPPSKTTISVVYHKYKIKHVLKHI